MGDEISPNVAVVACFEMKACGSGEQANLKIDYSSVYDDLDQLKICCLRRRQEQCERNEKVLHMNMTSQLAVITHISHMLPQVKQCLLDESAANDGESRTKWASLQKAAGLKAAKNLLFKPLSGLHDSTEKFDAVFMETFYSNNKLIDAELITEAIKKVADDCGIFFLTVASAQDEDLSLKPLEGAVEITKKFAHTKQIWEETTSRMLIVASHEKIRLSDEDDFKELCETFNSAASLNE